MSYYSLLIKQTLKSYNIFDLEIDDVSLLVKAYLEGQHLVTLSGEEYNIWPDKITFFEHQEKINAPQLFKNISRSRDLHFEFFTATNYLKQSSTGNLYFSEDFFIERVKAENVTKKLIGNSRFGEFKREEKDINVPDKMVTFYVDASIIEEIRKLPTDKFDFKRLVKLLEELNDNYSNGNLYSVTFLLRAIIDHIPPVFNKQNFASLANQNAFGSSNKKLVSHLQDFSRNVSDREIHLPISINSIIITPSEVDFKASLSALLRELINSSK